MISYYVGWAVHLDFGPILKTWQTSEVFIGPVDPWREGGGGEVKADYRFLKNFDF